jgi:hypothetical protein
VLVVSNIKGVLSGSMIVNQEGGYENGILRLVEDQPLMTVGTTYALTARTNGQGEYLASSYPRGWLIVSSDAKLTVDQLRILAATNKIVLTLQDAYKHEILFQFDVDNRTAFNSYKSLQTE